MAKWLAGIAASIVAALIIWFLTHEGGPLNPKSDPVEETAVLRIVDIDVTEAQVNGRSHARVSVFNEGEATGESCSVWWFSGSEVAAQLEAGLLASKSAVSGDFGLTPGETEIVELDSLPYTSAGVFRSYLQASCAGFDIVSDDFTREVVVRP